MVKNWSFLEVLYQDGVCRSVLPRQWVERRARCRLGREKTNVGCGSTDLVGQSETGQSGCEFELRKWVNGALVYLDEADLVLVLSIGVVT